MSKQADAANVLVVDDERDHAEVMCEALTRQGHQCAVAHNLPDARALLNRRRFDVIVTDLRMEGERDGLALLGEARGLRPAPPVILVSAHNDVPTSRQALAEGAYDYIVKPLDLEELRAQVNRAAEKAKLSRENEVLEARLSEGGAGGFEGIVGKSAPMMALIATARQVAASDIPVLILGESGTGKELVARAIHEHSRRRRARMVTLNCAGLSESILEDELFGHVKGAFTGAQTDRAGRFEHADGGTLFLDEIGDMPAAMQAKLLRALEYGEVVRLGSNDPRQVDVRVVSATNRDLDALVEERRFREDLYFRIKGVTLRIPALRERREDIPLLAYYFMKAAAERFGKPVERIDPAAQQALNNSPWPGNVRQLKLAVENMVVLSSGPTLTTGDLPNDLRPARAATPEFVGSAVGKSMEQIEREHIERTLDSVQGNREQASRVLGIGERTLYRKIKEYGLK